MVYDRRVKMRGKRKKNLCNALKGILSIFRRKKSISGYFESKRIILDILLLMRYNL